MISMAGSSGLDLRARLEVIADHLPDRAVPLRSPFGLATSVSSNARLDGKSPEREMIPKMSSLLEVDMAGATYLTLH
jgi:hypothetical protein